ncbi:MULTISPECIES: hypothetical protein [Emticicia]|uniref:helix-turn-helix transcriptional regulator n=1 Tax=Emticicia TaxID=312278 RepID=UPI0007D8BD19|nr:MULTISPECIES: hypothetical protein [Emticicia]
MRKTAPIGKMNTARKKFKSAKPNELSASDKNSIRNNINKLTKQQLAFKIGKPLEVIEKFIKKEHLVSVLDIPTPPTPVEVAKVEKKEIVKKAKKKVEKKSKEKIKVNAKELPKTESPKPQKRAARPLSEKELQRKNFILANYKKYTIYEMAEKLNCHHATIRFHLKNNKLKGNGRKDLVPPKVIQFLKVNYHTMTAREMSIALGNVSWSQVRYLCEKNGFIRTPEETSAIRLRWNKSEFTKSEEKYILENHGKLSFAEIAQNIERTRSSVVKLLRDKGLKITKEQHDALNRKNFEKGREAMQAKLAIQKESKE